MPPYQGTLDTIRHAVADRLKLEYTADTNRLTEWVNLAYIQACQETGCLQGCGVTALTQDAGGYQLAPEVHQIKAIHYLYPNDEISDPLEMVSLDRMLQLRRADGRISDRPGRSYYTILGQNRLELWPEPGYGAALKFWYVSLPPALVNGTDTPLIKEPYGSKLLELGACVEGSKFKKDPFLQSYQQEHFEWMRKFQGFLNRRRGVGDSMQMVVDNFDYGQPNLALVRETG